MIDYKNLIDIVYIEHPSNENYREEYIESFKGMFTPRAVMGRDNDLEYGRRQCIFSSSKKYIMLNDADDVYIPETIKTLVDYLESSNGSKYCAVVAREYTFTDGIDTPLTNPKALNAREYDISLEMLKISLHYMHNCVLYRTEALKRALRDFKTHEYNYDYAFKKELLASSGGSLARMLPIVGMSARQRVDGHNWNGAKRIKKKIE